MAANASSPLPAPQANPPASGRLLFLDVVRGMTVAFMILVNNNGSEHLAYWPLKHAAWNGWTPTDLVFPTFLFLVGITTVLSTASRIARGESRRTLLAHAARRAATLFVLGILIHGFPHYPLHTLRIYGVLQRIAICYFVATLLYLWSHRVAALIAIAAACLLGYWVLLRWVPIPGHGLPGRDLPFLDPDINWVSIVDRRLFPGRLLEGTRDPLGLLSAIPAIGTCLLGMLTGLWLRTQRTMQQKAAGLLAGAAAGLASGWLWSLAFPINKRLWTSSYVLFAAGWTLLLMAACLYLIDIKKLGRGWATPWKVFGSNAIFVYALSELLSIALELVHLDGHPLKQVLFTRFFQPIHSPVFGSLLFSLAFVLTCYIPCYVLYRKKIFLKL